MKEEGLVVFYTTHDSIKADNICINNKLDASLIPTHPSITLGCGFMLKTNWENFTQVVKLLDEEKVNYKALYYSTKTGVKREVELLFERENI